MKYTITLPTGFIYETSDIDDFNKMREEFKYRRSGRTTKMIFSALGDWNDNVVIIGWDRMRCRGLYNEVKSILTKLGFEFKNSDSELTISNFNKTYYFRTKEQVEEPKWGPSSYNCYLDSK